ncbi:hypothetical protein FQN54_001004 [Arachnomyces sp. PD_36]|nr:hypothetical protein FQN54_001004 [Arachnomyces sp. PD_36]
MSSRHVVITGDAPVDMFLYPSPMGLHHSTGSQRLHTHYLRRGAGLLADFLGELEKQQHSPKIQLHKPTFHGWEPDSIQSITELDLHTVSGQGRSAFKLKSKQHLNTRHGWHAPGSVPSIGGNNGNISLWLLQDADCSFNDADSDAVIELFRQSQPQFLLYHMARPLCSGKIWETLRNGPFVGADRKQDPEKVIVIIDANDLRAEGIELSHGLSWEKTSEGFVEQLGSVGRLVSLVTCAHLIVRFGCAGAIYHRGLRVVRPTLFFDPLSAEGDFARRNLGHVPGEPEAFVAGFTKALIESKDLNVEESIESGLRTARRLARRGLSIQDPESPQCSPVHAFSEIMGNFNQAEDDKLIKFLIPSDEISRSNDPNWSLLDYTIGDPSEVARRIVKEGTHSPASHVPLARFNRLVLVDRHDIESFRTLFNFLEEYLAARKGKPLSIALFGPRGSGKSFSAFQVAEAATKGQKTQRLRFDLSQFTGLDDLLAAFHSVRDCTLEGFIPLVYFNGFDTPFSGTQFGWFPYLLPPMLAGKFSDRGISRPIGSAVFFFGATVVKNHEMLCRLSKADSARLTLAHDFLGCLHGFVNVLGPDRSEPGDRLYPVRRAVILRALLEEREPNLITRGKMISIDDSVLNRLLLVPEYRQGIRSLKAIIAMSRLNGCRRFERAALPPKSQMDVHVEYSTFMRYANGIPIPQSIREGLARSLHEVYIENRRKIAVTSPARETLQEWSELDEEFKESARAHADSIPQKLRLISCFLSEKQEYREPVKEFTPAQIELLAENEHDRWNAERLQKQWHLGELAPAKRKSPFLVPWANLGGEWRNIDRVMVASYPKILPQTYEIYKMGTEETDE